MIYWNKVVIQGKPLVDLHARDSVFLYNLWTISFKFMYYNELVNMRAIYIQYAAIQGIAMCNFRIKWKKKQNSCFKERKSFIPVARILLYFP